VTSGAPTGPDTRVERRALLYAAAGCFCLLGGYYILRPIREALALEVGVRNNFVLFSIVFGVTIALLPVYWWFVRRTPRTRLVWLVNATFAGIFFALALGLYALPRDRLLASVYFVALTSTNFLLIAVFWSAMSDVWRPELAKRFYGYVAAGGSAGAIAGNVIVRVFVVDTGLPVLIMLAAVLVVAAAALVSTSRATLRRCAGGASVPDGAIPVGGRALDDLKRLATTPYLLGIVGIIVIGQTIGAFMYNEQGKYIASLYSSENERAAMFANIEIAVNLLSLVFQAVVVTWLTRRGSVALSLSAMPLLVGSTFVVLALIPTGVVLLVTQVIRRAAEYGLGKPPREMLFTVLNPESKFKSKALIDTVLVRGADTGGQWLYRLVEATGVVGMSWICVGLCVGLLAASRTLGRAFEMRRGGNATPQPSTA
jgi:AAA family ATP:ADP antiporter